MEQTVKYLLNSCVSQILGPKPRSQLKLVPRSGIEPPSTLAPVLQTGDPPTDPITGDNRQKVSKTIFTYVILLAFGIGGTGEELNLRPLPSKR